MPVPSDDMVCRFIPPGQWSRRDNRPRTRAFKQVGLSVWHRGRLHERNVALEDLLIENLAGYGQAHHLAGDYLRFADRVVQEVNTLCQVRVEWRPDEVTEPWRQWRNAHVQVEAIEGPADFPLEFRRLLAANSRLVIPPDLYTN